LRLLSAFLAERGMPDDLADLSREHIEKFIADILTRSKPSTASVRYRAAAVLQVGRERDAAAAEMGKRFSVSSASRTILIPYAADEGVTIDGFARLEGR
jgi:hypothetical protein